MLALIVAAAMTAPNENDLSDMMVRHGLVVGEREVVLADESRVDVLGEFVAWEVDWAYKWAEGVGQCLLYAHLTGKRPGLILLTKNARSDKANILRAALVCHGHGIELVVMPTAAILIAEFL